MFLRVLCVINVAVGAPQLDIPGVRPAPTISTIREQEVSSFPAFPIRFNQDRNIEAEISSLSVEDGTDTISAITNRFNTDTARDSLTRTTTNTVTASRDGDEESVMLMPYSFNYNVADDSYQTYIARQEDSDGETVVGSYSYVDPTGALITVNYRAGLMGYTETREKQANFLKIRSQPSPQSVSTTSSSSTGSSATSSGTTSSSSSTSGSGSSRFSSGSGGGSQQLTTTTTKKKSIDQAALIAQILAALQPQISSIVDSSIDEVEEVTEEKTVTVQEIPNRVSTVQFSQQNRGASQNLFG